VSDPSSSTHSRAGFRPLGIVPDANVFTERVWVDRLIDEAQAGRIRVYWSPKTIEEVGRVRFWIWIKKALRMGHLPVGSSAWKALWARYSEEAHRWFARVSAVCEVIEDREPHEPAWSDPIPDPNDAWLWNAARRANADLVVTANLRDAPPIDAQGSRRHERIGYIHPRILMLLLDVWLDIRTTRRIPDDLDEYVRRIVGAATTSEIRVVVAEIRAILARMAREEQVP
jgi:hypothetical protein